MITLKQLFQVFSHDAAWATLAMASAQSMNCVLMRKLGDKDVTTITDSIMEQTIAESDQPNDRKVKARACLKHMTAWARTKGYQHPAISQDKPKEVSDEQAHPPERQKRVAPPVRPKIEPSPIRKKYNTSGTVYHDTSSKGYSISGKRVFKDCWRAEITIAGQRYRHRGQEREDCETWLKAVKQGKIKPTDNKADWWRMEQRKDEEARIDEMIVSAAEEANIVYEYRQTGDTAILFDYCVKSLLPHMVYYCAHTLRLGEQRTLKIARQAVGLILTMIVGGRPVTNITYTCKNMLRTYRNRGNFWYYDKAPESVKLMVNGIDMSALTDLYKVTKDRRI